MLVVADDEGDVGVVGPTELDVVAVHEHVVANPFPLTNVPNFDARPHAVDAVLGDDLGVCP